VTPDEERAFREMWDAAHGGRRLPLCYPDRVPDPFGITLNCPKCGAKLTYSHSNGDTHLYRCPKHGVVVLPPRGIARHGCPSVSDG
jgi:hypothetical protein